MVLPVVFIVIVYSYSHSRMQLSLLEVANPRPPLAVAN